MIKKIKHLPLSTLISIRFLACPTDGLTISEIKKSLNPIFHQALSNNEWSQCLQQLVSDGLLEKVNRSRFHPTKKGQKQALQQLDLQSPPTSHWLTLRNRYLIANLLDLSTTDHASIASANGLRAAILVNAFQLTVDVHSTLTKVRDNLLWQQLAQFTNQANQQHELLQANFIQARSFTIDTLASLLLGNLLETKRKLSWDSALKQLAAKAVEARRITPGELRLAILRKATQSIEPQSLSETPRTTQPEQHPELFNLEHFAHQVYQSAKHCQTGKFGGNKLFISHVWRQMQRDNKTFGLDLNKFKHYLTLANNKRLISLSRADLPYAMDPEDVAMSETAYLNATFHFIRLES